MLNSERNSFAQGNNSFLVSVGKIKLSFSKVENISQSASFETLQEGGVNDFVHILTKSYDSNETLVLSRGVSSLKKSDIKDLGFTVGGIIREPVTISVIEYPGGEKAKVIKSYGFDYGRVVRWSLTNLDALGNEMVLESFEISHTGLKEI